MASRFALADEEIIKNLKKASENENTRKSTGVWMNIFRKWASERNVEEKLEIYEASELDSTLCRFFAEIRKENGEDFEPDSLKVMLAALERYLKDNNYQHSLLKDVAFQNSRKVLEGKQEIYARREREKDPKKPKV